MKYQLILQFDAANIEGFDQLIEIEKDLKVHSAIYMKLMVMILVLEK
jgi:hypothetical protein